MVSVTKVELEDGILYTLVDEIENEGIVYYYLANEEESFNFQIRKIVKEESDELISGLESDEEFEKALTLYNNKHRTDDL